MSLQLPLYILWGLLQANYEHALHSLLIYHVKVLVHFIHYKPEPECVNAFRCPSLKNSWPSFLRWAIPSGKVSWGLNQKIDFFCKVLSWIVTCCSLKKFFSEHSACGKKNIIDRKSGRKFKKIHFLLQSPCNSPTELRPLSVEKLQLKILSFRSPGLDSWTPQTFSNSGSGNVLYD